MDIYIYIEKKKVYNIEGQLRGLQGSPKWKTCAPQLVVCKMFPFCRLKHLYPRRARFLAFQSQDTRTGSAAYRWQRLKSLSATAVGHLN